MTAPDALLEQARGLHAAGRLDAAIPLYRRILAHSPALGDALHLLGTAEMQRGRGGPARILMTRARRADPAHSAMWNNLALILRGEGRGEAAIQAFRRAMALQPAHSDGMGNLAVTLRLAGQTEAGGRWLRRAVAAYPAAPFLWNELGVGALDTPEAERPLRRAVALDPAYGEAIYHRGLALQAEDVVQATLCYRRAVILTPDFLDAWMNRGVSLAEIGDRAGAQLCYARALALQPSHGAVLNNIGHHRRKHNEVAEALGVYDRAIRVEPNQPDPVYNRGIAKLVLGDFTGMVDYEARWRVKGFSSPRWKHPQPLWDGRPLDGRTLLVHAEQGFGDTLQFVRYVPLLAALGGRVVLEAQKPLLPLLAGLPGLDGLVGWGDPRPPFDCHAPLLSLPRLLGTRIDNIPADIPYLAPPADRVALHARPEAEAKADRRLRVGLVWAGNPTHRNDRNRSLSLAALAPILAVPGLRFFSLQMGMGHQADALEDMTAGIRDFADSAALVQTLDLLITVDTSVAHLAGALGRPVWVLLPFAPDWRWMLERADSPWYPTMRLFRQTSPGDWPGVIDRVAEALRRRDTDGLAAPSIPSPDIASLEIASLEIALESATALHRAGQEEKAEKAYRDLLAAYPGHGSICNNLGILLRGRGRIADAVSCFRQQVATAPEQAQGRVNLAVALRDHGQPAAAERLYRQALALDPGETQGLYNHGNLLLALSRPDEAERQYRRAARLTAAQADIAHNWANALHQCDRVDEALKAHRLTLALDPTHLDGWGQMAKTLLERNRLGEALACCARGLRIQPDHATLHYNRALMAMLAGRLRESWAEYEWRWRTEGFPAPIIRSDRPRWRGESLAGKTILLHAEQGFGDSLHFLRYLPLVTERAARVLLAVPAEMAGLVPPSDNLELLRNGQGMPAFDVHCPFFSLPLALDRAMPNEPALPFLSDRVPYLRQDPERVAAWRGRLPVAENPAGEDFRVGLVWAGNPKHANDARRSLPLAQLRRLVERLTESAGASPAPTLHSLQVGARNADRVEAGLEDRLHDLAPLLTDYAETAAALAALDLLITVDTSIAHLAGALGRPVWVLLPFAPDWRWMLERADSPWYPTMRLFRQTSPGDWPGVIDRVAEALSRRATDGLRPPSPPPDPEALRDRAEALLQAGRSTEARVLWRRLAAVLPGDAEAWHRLDVVAFQSGDLADAARCGRRSLRLEPANPMGWTNLGVYERRLGRAGVALACQRRGIALAPDVPHVLNNLANALGTVGALKAALGVAGRVIRLLPEKADAHHNHAILLKEMGRTTEAMDGFRAAQRLRPGYAEARFHEALLLLLSGRMDAGWEAYESRWDQPHCKEKRHLAAPQWRGEPLDGKTILVHAEQGFGDSFQFVRYLPLLRARGARVVTVMQAELEGLVARMGAVDQPVASGEELPPFDLHCPLLSLPLGFATTPETVPATVPYLRPDPDRQAVWSARFAERFAGAGTVRHKVGLVWAGRPTHGNDANRSLTLTALAPLARIAAGGDGGSNGRIGWVSLQKGEAARQAMAPPPGMALWNLDPDLTSFEETAAALMALDLVITVDTSVAHLAGALGRPVWVLLPFHPDWRWMLERADSPWYPTMRLFRQKQPGDWVAVIRRVAAALAERINEPEAGVPDRMTTGAVSV